MECKNKKHSCNSCGEKKCGSKHNCHSADVVDVVRCKDCKHFGKYLGQGKHACENLVMPYCLETDYCSYGERRANNER